MHRWSTTTIVFAPPLRWHFGDWAPACWVHTEGSGWCAPCLTVSVGCNANPLEKREVKNSAVDLDVPRPSLCGRLCVCAQGSLLQCDVDGVAAFCALVHLLCGEPLFHIAPPFCVGEWRCVGGCWPRSAHCGPPQKWHRSAASRSTQTADRDDVRVCSKHNEDTEMQCVTANLICVWLRRMEHVRQYALGVALMIVEEGRHEIVALCVLCGRGMPAIVRDVEDAELFDWGEVADVAAQRGSA
ncbi:hypothetical protein TcBrA4_0022170 [Trypanosoma cruzi]|nr:hypothetical protein TcBrA4_0022170 [Trypanosoma cruzi]